ncbi:autoinducer binding domain-containing protein [Mesorhizobium sp. IMUNJ 23232]|uniref:helix-turn-helix transcriptional regulator n=1 Tax=Mesorhizobium sp. IMUNJ 23232 TaxID=3376064 RepID=UPI0037B3C040
MTAQEICSEVLEFASRIGASHLLAGVIPPPALSRTGQLSHVLLHSWPREWSERYFSSGYLYRDPTIRLVREGTASFLWSELDTHRPISLPEKSVMSEATEFRLLEGFTIALSTVERQPIGISIAGERLEFSRRERLSLELISAYAAGCAIVLMEGGLRPEIRLSPRQLDVLRWASEGLKNEEIADRLSISAHTAEMHLRAIREKLGVTNTVHAVAEALRLRIIF